MRLVRIPYYYLPNGHVRGIYAVSAAALEVIHDVHHGIPNMKWNKFYVQPFMYHPSFLVWCHIRAKAEFRRRGFKDNFKLEQRHLSLRSKPLTDFVPPDDQELAEDVVWLLEQWKQRLTPGGFLLPISYVVLAEKYYGYSPQQAAHQRVDYAPRRSRYLDAGWYRPEGEATSSEGLHPVEAGDRDGCAPGEEQ